MFLRWNKCSILICITLLVTASQNIKICDENAKHVKNLWTQSNRRGPTRFPVRRQSSTASAFKWASQLCNSTHKWYRSAQICIRSKSRSSCACEDVTSSYFSVHIANENIFRYTILMLSNLLKILKHYFKSNVYKIKVTFKLNVSKLKIRKLIF